MPRQRAIRFPDDLHDAIEAEAQRLGHPHTFSSVIINDMRAARGVPQVTHRDKMQNAVRQTHNYVDALRGSPSPSLERARKQIS